MNTLKNDEQRYKNIRCANFFFIFFHTGKDCTSTGYKPYSMGSKFSLPKKSGR